MVYCIYIAINIIQYIHINNMINIIATYYLLLG